MKVKISRLVFVSLWAVGWTLTALGLTDLFFPPSCMTMARPLYLYFFIYVCFTGGILLAPVIRIWEVEDQEIGDLKNE